MISHAVAGQVAEFEARCAGHACPVRSSFVLSCWLMLRAPSTAAVGHRTAPRCLDWHRLAEHQLTASCCALYSCHARLTAITLADQRVGVRCVSPACSCCNVQLTSCLGTPPEALSGFSMGAPQSHCMESFGACQERGVHLLRVQHVWPCAGPMAFLATLVIAWEIRRIRGL